MAHLYPAPNPALSGVGIPSLGIQSLNHKDCSYQGADTRKELAADPSVLSRGDSFSSSQDQQFLESRALQMGNMLARRGGRRRAILERRPWPQRNGTSRWTWEAILEIWGPPHPLSNSGGLARAKSSRSTVEGTETSAVHLGGGGQLTGTHKKSHQPMVARGLDFKAPACGKDCSLPAAAPQACMQP